MGPPKAAPPNPKLRILALHGFLQDAETFRGKVGSLRKSLKSVAELVCVDAPHVVRSSFVADDYAAAAGAAGPEGEKRGWWLTTDVCVDGRPVRPALSTSYTGWEESLQHLAGFIAKEGPFDGVLGFSQGASAVGLLCSAPQELVNILGPSPHFAFAILIGGFLPRDPSYAAIVKEHRPTCPSLHVMGTADELVPPARSCELRDCFETAEVFEHPGRHGVPCNAEFRNKLKEFLSAYDHLRLKQ